MAEHPAPRSSEPLSVRDGATTENRAQVQARVFEATERLLSEGNAYADLSVDKIAKAAGISRTAFYFYFSDKRELITGQAAAVAEELYGQAIDFYSGDAGSTEELEQVLREVYDIYFRHGVLIRAVVEVSTYDEQIAVFWRGLLNQFVSATEDRIVRERTLKGKDASKSDPRAMAFALTWMTERTLHQQLVQQEPIARDAIVRSLVEIFERSS